MTTADNPLKDDLNGKPDTEGYGKPKHKVKFVCVAQGGQHPIHRFLDGGCPQTLHRARVTETHQHRPHEQTAHEEDAVGRGTGRKTHQPQCGQPSCRQDQAPFGDELPASRPDGPTRLNHVGHPLGSPSNNSVGCREECGHGGGLDPIQERW